MSELKAEGSPNPKEIEDPEEADKKVKKYLKKYIYKLKFILGARKSVRRGSCTVTGSRSEHRTDHQAVRQVPQHSDRTHCRPTSGWILNKFQ